MSKADKILSIQYLRGLAALGVVFCHLGLFNFGYSGVYLFFLISGFIIVHSLEKSSYKPDQFFTFLLKRSIRIDPPYWAMIILYIGLGYFLNNLPSFKGEHFQFNPYQLAAHLFYAIPFTHYQPYNSIFWTLFIEFQFYILIGLLYFLSPKKAYKAAFLIVFVAIGIFSKEQIFNYSSIFATGIALLIFYQKRTWSNAILPISFLCVVAYQFGLPVCGLLLIGSIAIIFVNRPFKPLYILGGMSYSLYLTHSFVFELCTGIFKRLRFSLPNYQLLCIEVAMAITFAYLFYLLIEKPFIKLSKRIRYQRATRVAVMGSSVQTH